MEWNALIWSGFVATTLAIAFFWVARSFAWTTFSPAVFLGCLIIPDPRRPHTETLGFLLLLSLGSTLVPVLLGTILEATGGESLLGGVVAGGVTGILAAAAMPFFGTISACVKRGSIPAPGRFGMAWGRATPGIIIAGGMVYGATFGALLAAF